MIAGVHYWTPTVSTSAIFDYTAGSTFAAGNANYWEAAVETDWTIAKNMATGLEFWWKDSDVTDSFWQVDWRLKRSFGG